MNPTQKLHDLGQSLWLDNISRDMLNNGTLKRYIDELSVTGLTSNPRMVSVGRVPGPSLRPLRPAAAVQADHRSIGRRPEVGWADS